MPPAIDPRIGRSAINRTIEIRRSVSSRSLQREGTPVKTDKNPNPILDSFNYFPDRSLSNHVSPNTGARFSAVPLSVTSSVLNINRALSNVALPRAPFISQMQDNLYSKTEAIQAAVSKKQYRSPRPSASDSFKKPRLSINSESCLTKRQAPVSDIPSQITSGR